MNETQQRIESFVKLLAAEFGHRLQCVVLTGSHARGEARPSSDIDVWVFLDAVRSSDLTTIGQIVERLGPGPELNPQCTSFAEVNSGAFRGQFSPVQLHLDGVILHGRLDVPKPSPEEVLNQAGAIAAFVMMNARHYITVSEPEETLAQGKLEKWVLKLLMWALRYEAFWRGGMYLRSLVDLEKHTFSPEAVHLVQVYQQLLERTFCGPWMPVVKQAEVVAGQVMKIAEKVQSKVDLTPSP